jgi:hypothetical protein
VRNLLALAAILAVFGCKKDSDEDRIRAVVHGAIEAANKKSPSGVVENAAPSFKGPSGADTQEVKRILAGYFLSAGWLHVFERELTVSVDGDRGTARLVAVIARGPEIKKIEDVVPSNAATFVFDLELAKVGAWKLTTARYRME